MAAACIYTKVQWVLLFCVSTLYGRSDPESHGNRVVNGGHSDDDDVVVDCVQLFGVDCANFSCVQKVRLYINISDNLIVWYIISTLAAWQLPQPNYAQGPCENLEG